MLAPIFYTSYNLICGIVLINVAVAVLLEKMVDDGSTRTRLGPGS